MREELRGFQSKQARSRQWRQGAWLTSCRRQLWRTVGGALWGALTMVEAGNLLGVLAAVLLLMAGVAWIKLTRSPLLQRTDGSTGMDHTQGEFASELLFWAAGLSSAAMFLAVGGWIFG